MNLEKQQFSGHTPTFKEKAKINLGGKVLHKLVGGENLSGFFQGFVDTVNIQERKDENTMSAIQEFQNNKSGVIILNHPNDNFSDYIPLLHNISEESLQKTSFFAVNWTTPMFREEFGDKYDFVDATYKNLKDATNGLEELETRIKKVQNEQGYIFIIPGGGNQDLSLQHKEFKGLFKRIIHGLNSDIPILTSYIHYDTPVGYLDIYKRSVVGRVSEVMNIENMNNSITPILQSKILKVSDFKGKDSHEMAGFYEKVFNSL